MKGIGKGMDGWMDEIYTIGQSCLKREVQDPSLLTCHIWNWLPPVSRGAGCIFVEMLQGAPAFPGVTDVFDQLQQIFMVLGIPSEDTWPGVTRLPNYHSDWALPSKLKPIRAVWKRLSRLPCKTEDLVQRMLTLAPADRIPAPDALLHSYFNTLPPPVMHLRDTVSIFKVPGVHLETEFRDTFAPGGRVRPSLLPVAKFW